MVASNDQLVMLNEFILSELDLQVSLPPVCIVLTVDEISSIDYSYEYNMSYTILLINFLRSAEKTVSSLSMWQSLCLTCFNCVLVSDQANDHFNVCTHSCQLLQLFNFSLGKLVLATRLKAGIPVSARTVSPGGRMCKSAGLSWTTQQIRAGTN